MSGETSVREQLVDAASRYAMHTATARLLPAGAAGHEENPWSVEDELWVTLVRARNAFLTATVRDEETA